MPCKPCWLSVTQIQVLPYAPRSGGIRSWRFIIGAIIIWLLLLGPSAISIYVHKDDSPAAFELPSSAVLAFGAVLTTVIYAFFVGIAVVVVRHQEWAQRAHPQAPDKPGG